jgi:heme exporter protein A
MGDQGIEPATFSGTGLACRRGGHTVFAGLGFTIAPGGALVLRGANGSGKTTLLRLMAGLAVRAGGMLTWGGADIADDPESHGARTRLIGHLDGVKAALTVRENLSFSADLHGGAPAETIAAALRHFGLDRLTNLPARVLSAGQRHRLSLARLLTVRAPLWLLDEPTNALDDNGIAALAAAIADHRRKGGMVVIASHGDVPTDQTGTLDLSPFAATAGGHWSDAA